MSFDARKSKSTSFKKLNPHLFGLAPAIREPDKSAALDQDAQSQGDSSQCVPDRPTRFRIALIALRPRMLDSDNHIAGCKGLRDIIADWIGIDDGSDRILWEYGQVKSDANQTIVRIEEI